MYNPITIDVLVSVDLTTAWDTWVQPVHIVNWNFATPDWHCPFAENNLQPGGTFSYRMASQDGEMAFDFAGTHDEIAQGEHIFSHLDDGRQIQVVFEAVGDQTKLTQSFEPEPTQPSDLQQQGWQAIMHNYKQYVESRLTA